MGGSGTLKSHSRVWIQINHSGFTTLLFIPNCLSPLKVLLYVEYRLGSICISIEFDPRIAQFCGLTKSQKICS